MKKHFQMQVFFIKKKNDRLLIQSLNKAGIGKVYHGDKLVYSGLWFSR